MKFACLPLLLPLVLTSATVTADAAPKTPKKTVCPKKLTKATRINRESFRPNLMRRASHLKQKLKPKVSVETWGLKTTVTYVEPVTVRDPYSVTTTGAPRGASVELQAQEKSADIKVTGKPNQKTVAEALRWGAAFESHKITTSSTKQPNVIQRPQELDTHTPFRATVKDAYKRTARVTGNAKGRVSKVVRNTSERQLNGLVVNTVVIEGGEFLAAYTPWANLNNIRVTPASLPFGKADYKELIYSYQAAANRLEQKAGKKPSKEQANDLGYLRTASREAAREYKRISRVEKNISILEKRAKNTKQSTEAYKQISQRIKQLKSQMPSTESSARFVALAAFPANATVTLTNLRLLGDDAKKHTVTLQANQTGSVSGEIPAWQRDKIKMTVSYPTIPGQARGASVTESFNLPKNSNGSGLKIRGVEFRKVKSAEISAN